MRAPIGASDAIFEVFSSASAALKFHNFLLLVRCDSEISKFSRAVHQPVRVRGSLVKIFHLRVMRNLYKLHCHKMSSTFLFDNCKRVVREMFALLIDNLV